MFFQGVTLSKNVLHIMYGKIFFVDTDMTNADGLYSVPTALFEHLLHNDEVEAKKLILAI